MSNLTRKEKAVLNNLTLEDLSSAGVTTTMTRGEVVEYIGNTVITALKSKLKEIEAERSERAEKNYTHDQVPSRVQTIGTFLASFYPDVELSSLQYRFRTSCYGSWGGTASHHVDVSYRNGDAQFHIGIGVADLPADQQDNVQLANQIVAVGKKIAEIESGSFKFALMETLLNSTDAGKAIMADIETMSNKAVTKILETA